MTNHANNPLKAKSLSEETNVTRARYNRIAPIYDLMDFLPEQRFAGWRKQLWARVTTGRILEVGVGTGKNFPYHPLGAEVTGIDLSERMLAQARRRAEKSGYALDLRQMDAQQLDFPDDTFDAAVATFVFCSVPDAERGLRELARVVRPGGHIILLEHVRIDRPAIIGKLMDWLDPLVVRVMGAHINRRTAETVQRAGLAVEQVENLAPQGLVKLMIARLPLYKQN
jgi:phosphatidylethanolamine/phosphatidyl-N-methylethanolamine N-methyltransferase